MLKKIRPKALVPSNVIAKEDIRAGFHELLVDINQIVDQWNDTLQPLVDSLPGGRRRITARDRSQTIDPVTNGLDGSEVFMDMTATPVVNNGLLYSANFKRPKTIKEVVLDSYADLLQQIRQLKSLVDSVEAANADPYNDTDLRNWIRRLAANTVSSLDEGESFDSGYFAGNLPTKTVAYSLHQRDSNLRLVVGLGGDYSVTAPDFTGTTHITSDPDIIAALITLDGLVGSGGGATTLQEAYDGGNTIQTTIGRPVTLTTASNTTAPLTVSTISGAYAQYVSGNIGFLSGSTAVGTLGEYGSPDTLVLEQSSGKTLKLGHTGGIASHYGIYQDFYLNVNTGGLVELGAAGIRFRTGTTTKGGVAILQNQKEDAGRTELQDASFLQVDIVAVEGNSPKGDFKSDGSPADREARDGTAPSVSSLYKETIVKAVASFDLTGLSVSRQYLIDDDINLVSNIVTGANDVLGGPGVDTFYSWYDTIAGEGEIFFLTPIPAGKYTVHCTAHSASGTDLYHVSPYAKTATGFAFTVHRWNPGTNSWETPDAAMPTTLDFQVI